MKGTVGLLSSLLVVGLVVTASHSQVRGHWTSAAAMPGARTEVAATELGGKVYVVGGFGGDGLLEYDPVADSWRERASLPRPLHHTGAVSVGGRLYVTGGYTPTARHGLGAATVAGRIFVIAGGPRPGGSYSTLNEVFTP